jgi:SSS family solute:Na+ symporter
VTLACDSPGVETGFPAVLAQRDAIFPALIFAVGAMIVASLFTASPAAEQLAEFES